MSSIKRFSPDYRFGLNSNQIEQRYKQNLVNYDNQPKTKSIKEIIATNIFTYFNFINIILGAAIILTGIFSGKLLYSLKNCLFMGVIFSNTIISIVEEILSKKTIDKLSVLSETKICAIRDKEKKEIHIDEIVLDDIIFLQNGNQVVVDAIIENGKVEVNESFITGEEDPVFKKKGDLILSGSFIVSGSCYAKVEHIGDLNYISKISSEAKYLKKANSIIMDSFEKILKIISIIIIPIAIIMFISQYFVTNGSISSSIFATVASLIGMIPEGLILLTSSVMAVSVIRLSRYKVLVQELYCIETLARVDTICLDKTGTLTEGKMRLVDIKIVNKNNKDNISEILNAIVCSTNSFNSTFKAIKEVYNKNNTWKLEKSIEFSSSRKFLAYKFKNKQTFYLGAPDILLKDQYNKYEKIINKYSKDYRVLALASKKDLQENPKNLKLLCFILIEDVIRKEAYKTINYFKKNNVDVKIISGDNINTVLKIAKRVGLNNLKGIDVSNLSKEKLADSVFDYDIFGRVKPEQKKLIIKTLQNKGHIVGMTGDGVNDVLALKESDCSIALASGSEAARNVSKLVLLDSNFDSLPKIVAEGTRTINNIGRSASLLIAKTVYTMLLILFCVCIRSKYFFIPIQLTLITGVTIGIPSFILALESNKEIIKGNFLLKIIGRSLPAALTVFFNIIIVTLSKFILNINYETITTLAVYLTGMTGFIYLFRICKPFNVLRTALFMFLTSVFIISILFFYKFFNLVKINLTIIVIFILLSVFSYFIFNKLNDFINKKIKKFSLKKHSN